MIRTFIMDDYDQVYQLWNRTPGVGLRSIDDSREGIAKFFRRNPATNFVAEEGGKIIGIALGGHDGRRGYLYHVCVEEVSRRRSIGRQLVENVIVAMKKEQITKLSLVCFSRNKTGDDFWGRLGWTKRSDLNYYTVSIDVNNE